MSKLQNIVRNYLTQSSTYKGLFTILGTFGVVVSDGLTQAIIAVCVAVFGLIDVIIDERAAAKETKE
jgi:hypothetical protein